MAPMFNAPAPNVPYFVPRPDGKPIPTLFQPVTIRGVEFQNRIWLAPMCQYSSENGVIFTWKLAHLGGILTRGPGLSFGRISPECAGIWNDERASAWAKVVEFAHSQNQKIAIQLAHAGRKASTLAPFINPAAVADDVAGGLPNDTIAPSALPYSDGWSLPKELTKVEIKDVVKAFVDAAKRAMKAGFDVIEIHGGHGFLITSFLSPTSNKRIDEYGGSFENRIRFLVEVVDALRAVMSPTMPLLFRHARCQVPLAAAVKEALGDKIHVAAVGRIHTASLAESTLDKGQADVVLVGRMFLKNPSLVWSFAEELGIELHHSAQIGWPFKRRTPASRPELK
ncbi:FMN-linked oxidoreductase [Cerioporus squamosus]|nr:FMN-linked oxidoreductase [Cerioporus squamosus]